MQKDEMTDCDVRDQCMVCGCKDFIDRKLKRFCKACGTLCETCCDGGRE